MQKTCLITGGAGFIGSHLAKYLLDCGNKVQIIDDLSTGSIKNINYLKNNPDFSYVIADCQNKALMAELVDAAHEIYHLAAAVGVRMIVENPQKTIHLNYTLTEIVLNLASKKQKPILFTSTSEVYGKSEEIPFHEEGNLVLGASTKWRWSYACSKLLDEFMILSAFRNEKVPGVIVRLFNTVGPKQTGYYGMVIPNFVMQALKNEPITVFGDGTQSRCFCHVEDVVPMFHKLLNSKDAHGKIFNIGSDNEITVLDLAKLIKKKCNSSSEIIFIPYDEAYNKGFEDMKRRVPSLDKIKKAMSFSPKKTLDDIISDVAEYILRMNEI